MDYLTKATSKIELRKFASELRALFGIPIIGPFPVLSVLDMLKDVFFGCDYQVLPDSDFPEKTMARCRENSMGGYTVEIRESVYNKARKGNGPSLGFVCHEICHIFLFYKGFTPIYEYSFDMFSLRPFESVEWQAKYLCGEVMIPFEESIGMCEEEIINKYNVSFSYANSRVNKGGGKQ